MLSVFWGFRFSSEKKTNCHSNQIQTTRKRAKNIMRMGKSRTVLRYQENIFLLKSLNTKIQFLAGNTCKQKWTVSISPLQTLSCQVPEFVLTTVRDVIHNHSY